MGEDAEDEPVRPGGGTGLRLLALLGTRPEAVKLVPIVRAAGRHGDVSVRLVATGQHPAPMLEVLDRFGLALDGAAAPFGTGRSLSELAAGSLLGLAGVLESARPDVVLVQGDTTSAFAGALAAFHAGVPVAHVEAGLRTHDPARPFPEEMNRRLIDALATHLFPPTALAAANLAAEGLAGPETFVTGNTIVDALRAILAAGGARAGGPAGAALDDPRWARRVLVTAHRRESWGAPMDALAAGIADAARGAPDALFLVPLHPNPLVRRSFALPDAPPNLVVVDPLPYASFVAALARSDLALTDSGGVLEEATALGKPVLVLRERTERPEALEAGLARLVGVTRAGVAGAAAAALASLRSGVPARPSDVFGDGRAGERTVAWLRWRYGLAAGPPECFTPSAAARDVAAA